ncbi:MAG: patatin-like phospholipase family protein, partial [Pseudomonadota bacterium]
MSVGTSQNWFAPMVDFLKELPKEALKSLCKKANYTSLKAGDVLFCQDDPADYLYVVTSGTLVVMLQPSGSDKGRMIALIKKGEVIGEVAVFGRSSRSADVVALRDTELLRINRKDFEQLVERFPKISITIAQIMAARLNESTRAQTLKIVPKVITFIASTDGVDVVDAANRLAEMLRSGSGFKVFVQGERDDELDGAKLGRLEDEHDLVILCAIPKDSRWLNRCTRQSDRICLIANGNQPFFPEIPEQFLDNAHYKKLVDLYLLHPESLVCPLNTQQLLDSISFNRFFHIRSERQRDWERWARVLTGRGIGIVFSGGGARAYAQIGVLRALEEVDLPIDFVGGASMGGIIAAGMAIGWSVDEIQERIHDSFVVSNPLSDYRLPLKGLVAGRKVERLLDKSFGAREIPDLWLPFICVSTNLTTADVHVHETGKVCHALRASISLPGILPPVVTEEGVLVDGGVINNL